MSKSNPLAGLIGNYGDSDDDSDDGIPSSVNVPYANAGKSLPDARKVLMPSDHEIGIPESSATIHPAPIPHCLWSACYDESSGCTYYWNQQTNAVTWEAPPEYLLAVKLAQQQLNTAGSAEVSAEEWQLYQQALAEKHNSHSKLIAKAPITKPVKKADKNGNKSKNNKLGKKRNHSEVDEEKIELITSYHNSDSESNDEAESPVKPVVIPKPPVKVVKNPNKKPKTKPQVVEYGPTLPPNQEYTVPIGPEIPPEFMNNSQQPHVDKVEIAVSPKEEEKKPTKTTDSEDSQDENTLLKKLKDKAKILENLGGEIPSELQKIIEDETRSLNASPKVVDENSRDSKTTDNIDDLLDEIEKKEMPKTKIKKMDVFNDNVVKSNESSARNSPRGDSTPPLEIKPLFPSINCMEEVKPLFPSIKSIDETPTIIALIPSTVSTDNEEIEAKPEITSLAAEKKGANVYLMDIDEPVGNVTRKKLRISNSVLPERKKTETPAYTTKYSQFIDGFMNERTGLGFSKDEEQETPKNTISYGKGLMFTKGETLNEDKKEDDMEDLTDLVEAKLKYLSQLQPCLVTPVQEMVIQMQTLEAAYRCGALGGTYRAAWTRAAHSALATHERAAAPAGWTCTFQRSEGRYRYRRECDGLLQWEYPATANLDMDICTTPPHPGIEDKCTPPPPLPPQPPLPPLPPGGAAGAGAGAGARAAAGVGLSGAPAPPPPPPPPPPTWPDRDPPPPGCDDLPMPPLPPEPKQEIGDELLSFYNDIAELEKQTPDPPTCNTPEPPLPPEWKDITKTDYKKDTIKTEDKKDRTKIEDRKEKVKFEERKDRSKTEERKDRKTEDRRDRDDKKDRDKDVKSNGSKKKSKVKISSSMGMKHKSVSSLVAKWQQVAEEIHSD